jgi:WD40 repeat protein
MQHNPLQAVISVKWLTWTFSRQWAFLGLGRQARRRSWTLHGSTRTNEVLLWRCVLSQYLSQYSDHEVQPSGTHYNAQTDAKPALTDQPSGSSNFQKPVRRPSPSPPAETERGGDEEPEFDPSDREEEDVDQPQFPITHEIILKDHTKVVSALTLDPSGARILSGSHDYDCKLWDFGGMDARCKPFKSWEPAGTYYVRYFFSPSKGRPIYHYYRYTT